MGSESLLRNGAPDQAQHNARHHPRPDQPTTHAHRELIEELSHIGPEEWEAKAFYETERRTRLGTLLGAITGAPKRPFGHAFAHLPDLEAYVSSLPGV